MESIERMHKALDDIEQGILQNHELTHQINELYEEVNIRLELMSEIIDEIKNSDPKERVNLDVEERFQQKLMLRKLAGKSYE